jgi:nitrous oxidase accessory protein
VNRIDESLVLLRSSFVEMLNLAEKVAPALTPVSVADNQPLMKPVEW